MAHASTRREFLSTSATGALGLATAATTAVAANAVEQIGRGHATSKLVALGQAWMLNLEQQRIVGDLCDRTIDKRSEQEASDRFDLLVDHEVELSCAIRREAARTREELAIKARVVLRETNSFSNAIFFPEGAITPISEWDHLGVSLAEGAAASLALDLIRLAAEEA